MKLKLNLKPKNSRFSEKYRGEKCLNCGTKLELSDKYCPKCGQLNTLKKLSFHDFFYEFFGNLIAYDSRFYRTLTTLVFRPGKISKEYIEGKRARYANPFRFYLSVSIVFFILYGLTLSNNDTNGILSISTRNSHQPSKIQSSADYYSEKKLDTLGFFVELRNRISMYYHYYGETGERASEKALKKMGHKITAYHKWAYHKAVQLNRMAEDPTVFINYSLSKIPFFLFFLIPVFALVVWLFFRTLPFSYAEHLVFTFHVQSMLFVLFSVNVLINFIVDSSIFLNISLLVFLFYLYKALRNFYRQKRRVTLLKFLFLNFIFALLGLLTLVLALTTSFALF